MQIALGITFLVGGLLAVNWIIHLLFRPITQKDTEDDSAPTGPTEGP